MTNAIFASLHRLDGRPVSPATTSVPLRKNHARYELASAVCRKSVRLPSAARRRALRSGCDSLGVRLRLRSTFPARRPQTEAVHGVKHGIFLKPRLSSQRIVGTRLSCYAHANSTRIGDETQTGHRRANSDSGILRHFCSPGNFSPLQR